MHILTIATLEKHWTVDPIEAEAHLFPFISLHYQTLVRKNHSTDLLTSDLAFEWRCSPDGRRWTFLLDVRRFHDGTIVLASHVAASIARHVWPKSHSIFSACLRTFVEGASTCLEGEIPSGLQPDDINGEISITLSKPYCPFLEILAHPALGVTHFSHDDQLVGSGPMSRVTTHSQSKNITFERCIDYQGVRTVPPIIKLTCFSRYLDLEREIDQGKIDVALVERKHQLRLASMPQLSSTPLKDIWVGMLILNGAGCFNQLALRRDFYGMAQTLAKDEFGANFSANILPDFMLAPPKAIDEVSITPVEFCNRWRGYFSQRPVRVLYAPGRGPLTRILDRVLSVLQKHEVAHSIIETHGPADVYGLVALGDFDIVVRGWLQDYDDPDEYFGAFEKQGPSPEATDHYDRFFAKIRDAKHLADSNTRLATYIAALRILEEEYLFIPVCDDNNRLIHDAALKFSPLSRDPFDLDDANPGMTSIKSG